MFLYLWAQWLILTLCNSNRLLQSTLRYSTTLNQRQAAAVSPQETKFLQSLLKKTYLVVDKVSAIYFLWCVFDMIENIVTWAQKFYELWLITYYMHTLIHLHAHTCSHTHNVHIRCCPCYLSAHLLVSSLNWWVERVEISRGKWLKYSTPGLRMESSNYNGNMYD